MNIQLHDDLISVLRQHDNEQAALIAAIPRLKLWDVTSMLTIYHMMAHGQERTAREIEILVSRDGNTQVPDECTSCHRWTFDGKCGCVSQQQKALEEQLERSVDEWSTENRVPTCELGFFPNLGSEVTVDLQKGSVFSVDGDGVHVSTPWGDGEKHIHFSQRVWLERGPVVGVPSEEKGIYVSFDEHGNKVSCRQVL